MKCSVQHLQNHYAQLSPSVSIYNSLSICHAKSFLQNFSFTLSYVTNFSGTLSLMTLWGQCLILCRAKCLVSWENASGYGFSYSQTYHSWRQSSSDAGIVCWGYHLKGFSSSYHTFDDNYHRGNRKWFSLHDYAKVLQSINFYLRSIDYGRKMIIYSPSCIHNCCKSFERLGNLWISGPRGVYAVFFEDWFKVDQTVSSRTRLCLAEYLD